MISNDERKTDSSHVSLLQNAIEVNKKYEASLCNLISKLEDQLHRIQMKRKTLSTLKNQCKVYKHKDKEIELGGYVFGAPFFKDEDYFPGPSNVETQRVYKNKMLRFINLSLRGQWTLEEKTKMKEAINKQLVDNCDSGESIDWHTIATINVPEHTPDECKALWNYVLHPKLRKGRWTDLESQKLSETAQKYNYHNWEEISEEIDCQRSALQCFIHFHTEIDFDSVGGKWTSSEEKRLIKLVDKYKIGKNYIPWARLCAFFDIRTRDEIYTKFLSIDPNNKKGTFTEEEDAAIITAVITYNEDFKAIPVEDLLPGRTLKQVKARYFNTLKHYNSPALPWNTENDIKLLDLVQKHGRKWCLISKLMKFRNGSSCRHRFDTLQNFINKNPDLTIEKAPRKPKLPKRAPLDKVIYNLESQANNNRDLKDIKNIRASENLANMIDAEITEYFSQMNYYKNKKGGRMKSIFDQTEMKAMKNTTEDFLNIFGFKISINKIKENLSNIDLHNYTDTEKLLLNYMIGNYASTANNTNEFNSLLIPTTSKLKQPFFEEEFVYEPLASKIVKTYTNRKNKDKGEPKTNNSDNTYDNNASQNFFKTILPPNSSTLVGMRTIMIAMNSLKTKSYHKSEKELILESQLKDASIFKQVFRNIFLWPSLMSYIEPQKIPKNKNCVQIIEIDDEKTSAGESLNKEMPRRGVKRKLHQ